jgi:hypothetical protein
MTSGEHAGQANRARNSFDRGNTINVIQRFGSWKTNSSMLERYYGMHEVANTGVKLTRKEREDEQPRSLDDTKGEGTR